MNVQDSTSSTLDEILITHMLYKRDLSLFDYKSENQSISSLTSEVANSPYNFLQKAVNIAAALCNLDSAGISLIGQISDIKQFQLRAFTGSYSNYIFGIAPLNYGPISLCLTKNSPQLLHQPDKYFSYLKRIKPAIMESLVVPITFNNLICGTLWGISNREEKKFDTNDLRIFISIANLAGSALKIVESIDEAVLARIELTQLPVEQVASQKLIISDIDRIIKEKDLQIKEIHHRVKNNLQVISSLLNLQAGHIHDEETREIFRDSQTRVKVMSLIHEKLYSSTNLSKINLSDYITDLVDKLYTTAVGQAQIQIKKTIENINVDIGLAVSLGLAINELVSNAMKHAFKDTQTGILEIEAFVKNEKLILIVRDNGKGFPSDLDFRTTESLGLQLINASVEQHSGSIEMKTNGGTEFKMSFKL